MPVSLPFLQIDSGWCRIFGEKEAIHLANCWFEQLSLVSSLVVPWLSVVVTRLLGTRLSCVLFSWVLSRALVLVSRDLWRTTQNSR